MNEPSPCRWVTAGELRRVLDLRALMDAIERAHGGARPHLDDVLIGPSQCRYLVRSASCLGSLGSKLITIIPDNPLRGLPAVQALIVLFDERDGRPRAVLEATELTYWKTAADSALGARLLAREDAQTLTLAGAGGLGPWLVRGHCAARPTIERVLVWNRTGERAQRLAAALCEEGIAAEATSDLEAAVRAADIVSTATMAREPILKGAWLKPGAHVDLVGSFSPDTREADDAVLRRGRLFADCRQSALETGELAQPLGRSVIVESDLCGDLYDLIGRRCAGRENGDVITVFKNAGGAHLDLIVAAALLERLEAQG